MNRNGKKNKNYAELIKEFIKNNKKASICTMAIILVVLATVVTTAATVLSQGFVSSFASSTAQQ